MTFYTQALRAQTNSIHALLMREMLTRYGDRKLGFLWVIFEALVHVAVFAAIKYLLKISGPDGINVILFLTTGIVPFIFFRNVVNKTGSALAANKGLMVLPQLSFLDFFYARFFLEIITMAATLTIGYVLVVTAVNNLSFYQPVSFEINNFLMIFYGIGLLGLLGFGVGLLVAAISTVFDPINMIINVVMRFLYFTSGVLISVKNIPYEFHNILYWNPVIHCMEAIRSGFFSQYYPNEGLMDLKYPLALSGIYIFLGFIAVFKMQSKELR